MKAPAGRASHWHRDHRQPGGQNFKLKPGLGSGPLSYPNSESVTARDRDCGCGTVTAGDRDCQADSPDRRAVTVGVALARRGAGGRPRASDRSDGGSAAAPLPADTVTARLTAATLSARLESAQMIFNLNSLKNDSARRVHGSLKHDSARRKCVY